MIDLNSYLEGIFKAATWHEKQATICNEIASDEPRTGDDARQKAKAAAVHHAASAAGLRNMAYEEKRRAIAKTFEAQPDSQGTWQITP